MHSLLAQGLVQLVDRLPSAIQGWSSIVLLPRKKEWSKRFGCSNSEV
jgi:hypothetical protein